MSSLLVMESSDEIAIKSLLVKERFARDTGQWTKLRDSYHPDASRTRLHTMWFDGDIDEFVARSKKLHSSSGEVIHQIVPADIEIRGSRAVADGWCLIQARLDLNHHEYELKTSIRLFYRCEKVQGQWKIVTLEPIYLHDLLMPVTTAPSLPLADLGKFRKSYRFTAWMLQQRGISVANNLAGEDDAKSVEDLHSRHREWLNEHAESSIS